MQTHLTVQVLQADASPLGQCHPARARELLRKGRAQLVSKNPFTIILVPPAPPETP